MTIQESISQLENLWGHCADMAKDSENDAVWCLDVMALEMAISAMEKQISKDSREKGT